MLSSLNGKQVMLKLKVLHANVVFVLATVANYLIFAGRQV